MKKILLLGGSHRDIPLIKSSQELGYFVITLGSKKSYLGHKYSDKSYLIDFNDLKKVRDIIKNESIDFLLPGCGEESYLNTVILSQEFNIGNFDEIEVVQIIHNKWKFKEFCLKNNISTPKGIYLDKSNNEIKDLEYPIVVKPTNLSGGRGVQVVKDEEQLKIALNLAKKCSDEIFLEEYIEGQLIAYSIFIENQKIVYEFFAEDKSYLNKYLITTSYSVNVSNEVKSRLKHDIEKLAKSLMLVNGMFHLQVLVKNNKPYIIDVTRRIPGDFFPYLIEKSDNIDYSKAVVEAYTKGKIYSNIKIKRIADKFIVRHCVMPYKDGRFDSLLISDKVRDRVESIFYLLEKGKEIVDFRNVQIAIIFLEFEKYDLNFIDNINELIKVKYYE